ncbi:hypothetical protein XAC217_470043 [Xanthomonas citri pv. citri]|nr:hypothetical protein XAC2911_410003 [Xanthomonas citri pv. citri]CEE43520.1 hypothetical protein XAC908_590043 [Xanthomonas citri pv. citri]CEE79557.1 hypothetical protein XACLC80_510043 [Xanthomonas citri pv. citri]CEF45400.1 hypothetical protein XAC217_470043 [Xanthomonas citri pv. citri]CEH65380.1 hypothetical protein XAC3615_6430003 [Xanthomonas citri pv. citri]
MSGFAFDADVGGTEGDDGTAAK